MRKYAYKKRKRNPFEAAVGKALGVARVLGKDRTSRNKKIAMHAKKISHITRKLGDIKKKEIPIPISRKFMEFLSFKKIFVIWITFIVLFGVVYFLISLTSPGNGLYGSNSTKFTGSLLSSIYFSFVTATSTGFGDIVPVGISRAISIVEIICSMVIFAIVISKLVSFKQEAILDEIYEISLDEKVNRLRSALYLSRSDISRMNEKISEGRIPKTTIEGMWSVMNIMQETLMGIHKVICPPHREKGFLKNVGNFQVELALNSIALTLSRLNELLAHMDSIPYNWRSKKNTESIKSALSTVSLIEDYYTVMSVHRSLANRMEEIKLARREVEKHL
jgi:potassium channel LctB